MEFLSKTRKYAVRWLHWVDRYFLLAVCEPFAVFILISFLLFLMWTVFLRWLAAVGS